MLFLVRMALSILFGLIGVFSLLFAIEFHMQVIEAYRIRGHQNETSMAPPADSNDPQASADNYYRSMLGPIAVRYTVAGLFFMLFTASFILLDQRNQSKDASQIVYGPESK